MLLESCNHPSLWRPARDALLAVYRVAMECLFRLEPVHEKQWPDDMRHRDLRSTGYYDWVYEEVIQDRFIHVHLLSHVVSVL